MKNKKIIITVSALLALVLAGVGVVLYIPKINGLKMDNEYEAALELYKEGGVDAALALGRLDGYKDADQKSLECWQSFIEYSVIGLADYDEFTLLKNDGTVHTNSEAVKALGLTEVFSIVGFDKETLFLKKDGTVVSTDKNSQANSWKNVVWLGANEQGVIGLKKDGTVITESSYPHAAEVKEWENVKKLFYGKKIIGYTSDGRVLAAGFPNSVTKVLNNWSNIVDLRANDGCIVGLMSDGTVVAAGDNEDNNFDLTAWSEIEKIEISESHIVGLKTDGTVVAQGYDRFSQCSTEGWVDITDIYAGDNFSVGLKGDGTLIFTGKQFEFKEIEKWSDIEKIFGDAESLVALKTDGTLRKVGGLGINPTDWKNLAEVVGRGNHWIGFKKDGTAVVADYNWDDKQEKSIREWNDIKHPR